MVTIMSTTDRGSSRAEPAPEGATAMPIVVGAGDGTHCDGCGDPQKCDREGCQKFPLP